MAFLKIVAVALLAAISTGRGSLVPAVPALRYTQVAPPSVLPFSAQVSTFSRNLHVFDAPYAAGVIPGPPAIVQRALLPAPVAPLAPAPFFVPRLAPAPVLPAAALPGGLFARSVAPAPLLG